MKRIALLAVSLFLSATLHASRIALPMGTNVRNAELIAIADASPVPPYDVQLTLNEILKGDPAAKERRVALPQIRSSADLYVPRNAKGIAVLFVRGSLIEIYQKEEEIRALRVFIAIDRLPTERARLAAVRDRAIKEPAGTLSTLLRTQFSVDARAIRERDTLPVIMERFAEGDAKHQLAVIEALEFIGDPRAVPLLIKALRSPHKWVALTAERALRTAFPNEPGAGAALRGVKDATKLPKQNDYQLAAELIASGNEAAARPHFLRILRDPKQTDALVQYMPDWLERSIASQPNDAATIRAAVLPLATRLAAGNWLEAVNGARALRALRHPSTAEPLLQMLEPKGKDDSLFERSTRIAAFALYDLGGKARSEAIARLRKRADWPRLAPLFAAHPDPTKALIDELRKTLASTQFDVGHATGWIVYRLGDLRDPRAALPIAEALARSEWMTETGVEALLRIGGAEAERAVLPLLHAKDIPVRRAAMDVLIAVQKERYLPLLRRMFREDLGDRTHAYQHLGRIGTREDLAMVLPLADHWTGDRVNHYWAMLAVAELRRRYPAQP